VINNFYKQLSKDKMMSKYFLNHKTPNRSIYEYKHGVQIKAKKYSDFFENVIIKYAHNEYQKRGKSKAQKKQFQFKFLNR